MDDIIEETKKISEEIRSLAKEKNAVILAHIYQFPEIQEIADYVGDSLGLARQAAETNAEVIVFCGVHFMAESAAILSPQKTVLLPEVNAGCPMADMIDAEALRAEKSRMPDAMVVCYVNTTAAVKAESDIACTSANAVEVVDTIPAGRPILFVPDKNLGAYVAAKAGRKNMTAWKGFCNTHDRLRRSDVLKAKADHPEALVMAHPECRPEVLELADIVASTTGMLNKVGNSPAGEFIVCTEKGILYQLNKKYPDRKFYMASDKLICPDMKTTTLKKVRQALVNMEPRITVPEDVRQKALKSLELMLAIE